MAARSLWAAGGARPCGLRLQNRTARVRERTSEVKSWATFDQDVMVQKVSFASADSSDTAPS
eukprot:419057-Pyramimonas_sp.AAC.1